MLSNLKALIVVATLGFLVFYFSKSLCLRYMTAPDFARRRNAWFALTFVAFLSPSFWFYSLFAFVYLGWTIKKDANPLALFTVVTFTIPDSAFYIPSILINQLFDLSQYRILSLVILVPVAMRILAGGAEWGDRRLRLPDYALLGFLLIQILSAVSYESFTNTMRRSFLLTIDVMMLFYTFSRLKGEKKIGEVLAGFWLSCAVMAAIAVFERTKGWLLYTGLVQVWGSPNAFAWLFRGESLRAQAAAGHSINLGYLVAVALGMFLYLKDEARIVFNGIVLAIMLAAIYASGSRGAWVMTALVIVLFTACRPNAGRRLGRAAITCFCGIALIYVTPLKESVLDRLPFIGTADQDTVLYRQQLAEISWPVIWQHPLFGDPLAAGQMESLRQGQGIIDIVNGYIYALLFTGFVGLACLMAMFALSLLPAIRRLWLIRHQSIEQGTMGAALVSVGLATLAYIATAGYGPMTYILAGLLASYARAQRAQAHISHLLPRHSVSLRPFKRESPIRSAISRAHIASTITRD